MEKYVKLVMSKDDKDISTPEAVFIGVGAYDRAVSYIEDRKRIDAASGTSIYSYSIHIVEIV